MFRCAWLRREHAAVQRFPLLLKASSPAEHRELLATQTSEHVGGAYCVSNRTSKPAKNCIASEMPIRIVDALEVIDIERHERKWDAVLGPRPTFALEMLLELARLAAPVSWAWRQQAAQVVGIVSLSGDIPEYDGITRKLSFAANTRGNQPLAPIARTIPAAMPHFGQMPAVTLGQAEMLDHAGMAASARGREDLCQCLAQRRVAPH